MPRSGAERGFWAALRFWVALALGVLSALLTVLTLITREWIEIIFGVDPDGGNGDLEWVVAAVTAVTAIACLGYARLGWRRARVVKDTGRG